MDDRNEKGQFLRGIVPANAIQPGERRAPATEFQPGSVPPNKMPVGSVTERRHTDGSIRAWVKVDEPNVWIERSKWVWLCSGGPPVPRGFVLHHNNEDPLDDRIENLSILSRSAHISEHREKLIATKREALRNGIPERQMSCRDCGVSFMGKREPSRCPDCAKQRSRQSNNAGRKTRRAQDRQRRKEEFPLGKPRVSVMRPIPCSKCGQVIEATRKDATCPSCRRASKRAWRREH